MAKRLPTEAKILIENSCRKHGLRAVSFQKAKGGEEMVLSFNGNNGRCHWRTSSSVTVGTLVDDEAVMTAIKNAGGPLAALAYRQAAGA